MSESHAEQLDPSVLGEDVGDDRPVDDYPPEEPLGVDDPNIVAGGVIARDDVATREARHVPDGVDSGERGDGQGGGEPSPGPDGLIDPHGGPGRIDDEPRLLADEATTVDESPEAAAVHDTPA